MQTFRLDEPLWLALVALVIPLALIGLAAFRAMSLSRRWVSILWRLAFIAALAAALAGASRVKRVDRIAVIGIVDLSGSVRELFDPGKDARGRPRTVLQAAAEHLNRSARARRPDDVSALLVFDRTAGVLFPIERRLLGGETNGAFLDLEAVTDVMPGTSGSRPATDIAGALRLAAAMAPPDAVTRLILFTDGRQTQGDALKAAAELSRRAAGGEKAGDQVRQARAGIPVDVVPLNYDIKNEVAIEAVEAPGIAPGESTVQVRVTINTQTPVTGVLGLVRDGQAMDVNGAEPGSTRPIALPAGRTTVSLPVRLPADRVHEFEAVFTPDPSPDGGISDRIAANNRGSAVTLSPGRGSVLVIDGVSDGSDSAPGSQLGAALRTSGLLVQTVSPTQVTSDPLYFQRYDLVILQNVPVDSLAQGVPEALAGYVSDLGGGLVMTGGRSSFGAGGWKGTAVEPILPVLLDLPERLVTPGTAVMIVMDVSGSMNFRVMGSGGGGLGRSQIEIAREGAVAAVEALDKTDMVGMITFHNNYDVLVPLAQNKNPGRTATRIRGIRAEGGTNLPPALSAAGEQLDRVKAEVKHIIVLSDGRSQGNDSLPGMAEQLSLRGIRISTIAVGDEADTFTLAKLAEIGQGTFYRVTDPNLLPRMFVKAVRIVRTPLIRESPFRPMLLATGSPLIEGLGAQTPPLGGMVLTQARNDKTVTYAMAAPIIREGEGGEPVLAHWNAGLGRVTAFTSDAHEWAADWIGWPGYTRLWTQIARETARPQVERGQELLVEIADSRIRINFIARDPDGKPIDLMTVGGVVFGPGGKRTPVTLAQTAPGEYQATAPASDEGTYVVTLSPRINGSQPRALAPAVGAVTRSGADEFRALTSDPALLDQIAKLTGGRVRSLNDAMPPDAFDRAGLEPAVARTPLWRLLMLIGVGLFVVDVASRRVAWDRWLSREFGTSLRRSAAAAVRDRGQQAAAAMGRLASKEQEFGERAEFSARAEADSARPLGEDDAKALVKAEAERRRKLRDAARAEARKQKEVSQTAPEPAPTPSATRGDPTPLPSAEPAAKDESSLLAAKRRAKRKMEE